MDLRWLPIYMNFTTNEFLHADPLIQNPSYPEVTFFDEPKMKTFTSDGGHVDFENGVEVTVPSHAVQSGSHTNVQVQPSLASSDVFVMPQGVHSASPSYLITGSGPELTEGLTLTLEHHANAKTKEDIDDLMFLCADSVPSRSGSKCQYKYSEVPGAKAEFDLKDKKGKLTVRQFFNKFFKIGLRERFGELKNLQLHV